MSRPVALVMGFWLAFGLAASVHSVYRPTRNTVFPVYVAAVERLAAGQDIYIKAGSLDYFRYPPPAVLLLAPFTLLGPAWGGAVWRCVSLAVYGWGVHRLGRDVLPGEWTSRRTAWLLALAGLGATPGIWNAQSNALVAGFVLLGASSAVRERIWAAAAWLGLAVLCKPLALPMVLLVCAARPALVPRLAVVVLAGLGLPFLVVPPGYVVGAYHGFVRQSLALSGERWPGFRDAWTAWLVLSQGRCGHVPDLRQPIDSPLYRGIQVVAALGAFLLVRRIQGSPGDRLTVALGLGGGWLMLLGPASEAPTFAFLAPLLAWPFAQRDTLSPGAPLPAASACCAFVLSWGGLFAPLYPLVPWLVLALPAACGLFLLWLALWLQDGLTGVVPSILALPSPRPLEEFPQPVE